MKSGSFSLGGVISYDGHSLVDAGKEKEQKLIRKSKVCEEIESLNDTIAEDEED